MKDEKQKDNIENYDPSIKGDGTYYYQEMLIKEQKITPEEKASEDAWWAEVSKNFTYLD